MEKKKNTNLFVEHLKQQAKPRFSKYKKTSKSEETLVNNNIIYNLNNINIPKWKYLTKSQKVAFFFTYIVDKSWYAITLRFSDSFAAGCSNNRKISDFIRRRINENLKNKLGYVPEYLFSIEFCNGTFHIHGAIKPNDNIEIIKKVLKNTAFSKNHQNNNFPEQYKLRCRTIYDALGWGRYILKSNKLPKFDIYICAAITRRIAQKYQELTSLSNTMKGLQND